MKINKSDLQNALEIVRPGLANRELIEQSTSFAFMENRVVTYNDEISISHQIEGLEITGAVNATELYNLLAKLKKEEIELEVNESELQLKCGRAKASFTLQSEIKLPIGDIGKIGKWKTIPDDLLKAMEFVMGSASKDNSKPVLTCVHVNKTGFVEASDSFRILKMTLNTELPVGTFLIPASSVSKVVKLNPVQIAEGNGWVHFKIEKETTISCRIFADDSFPDTSTFFEINGTKITLPERTQEVLDKASVFCSKGLWEDTVDITLEEGLFKVQSKSESGCFEEECRMRYNGEPVTFSISPLMLKDILGQTLDCTIAKNRLMFAKENWIYLTVLRNKI
jgi:DNA polymerase III sliding clamp (beta) subunit (PCNA family)